jgi:hypothetical protein
MRFLIAAFLLAHGFAHLVGLAGRWQLASRVPPKTTLLGGRVDLGEPGIRAFGLVWLLAAIAFAATAAALLLEQPLWTTLLLAAASLSLAISLLALPDAHIGVWINVVLLAFLYLAPRFRWLEGLR